MSFNITVEGGKSVRLKTKGKYCDRDIVVAAGGGEVVEPVIEPLEVTENGTYTAPDGVDGYSPVVVNVPIPDGYIVPNGTQEITANGSYDVTDKAGVVVAVPEREIVLQDKEITANGIYSADDSYDGLGEVNVNVPIPDGYIQPSGELEVTENGVHDVTAYASVNVNVPTGGGGDSGEEVAALLGNTMTELNNSIVTSLRTRVCQGATKLVTVNLPQVTSLGSYAFYQCSGLVTAKLPKLTSVSTQVFYGCTKLQHADCGQLGNIPAQTFNACSALTELILRKTGSICTLSNVNGVNNSPIGKGTGYVYVPKNLIESYALASNWSTYATQFRAIEDYPDICGG